MASECLAQHFRAGRFIGMQKRKEQKKKKINKIPMCSKLRAGSFLEDVFF
jgi:hypothetical protein